MSREQRLLLVTVTFNLSSLLDTLFAILAVTLTASLDLEMDCKE